MNRYKNQFWRFLREARIRKLRILRAYYGFLQNHPRLRRIERSRLLAMRRIHGEYQRAYRRLQPFIRWWKLQDSHNRLLWRSAHVVIAVVLFSTIVIPILNQVGLGGTYKLDDATLDLVGAADPSLAKSLTYDAGKSMYEFNQSAVQTSGSVPTIVQTQVGTAQGGKDKSLYSVDLPQNLSQGVSYYDTNSQLSFSLTPDFATSVGKLADGHIVYPMGGDQKAIYTLKNNGLKEDIIVPAVTGDTMRFSYKLNLPDTLEAKVIPDGSGDIGIYSADPTLFASISYGSSADQAAVEKARVASPKTHLVFGLPSPVIKAPNGKSPSGATARFELNGNTLSVIADDLSGISTPISIDPSVVVTSTSDFQTAGNNDGNIDFGSNADQIDRSALTGGSITGTWSAANNLITQVRDTEGAAAYNGYMYVWGGVYAGGVLGDTQYAPINSNGTLGSWTAGTNLNTARGYAYNFEYNGYLYAVGGSTGPSIISNYEYAAINPSTHTIGSWTQVTPSGFSARDDTGGIAVWKNYVYLTGGENTTPAATNTVQYAPINANGTLGTFTTSGNSFTTIRVNQGTAAYNGYLYVMGGSNEAGTTWYNDVQYAPINADGTIGTFTTTTSFPNARADFIAAAYGGYLYVMGGGTGISGTRYSDIEYAPINANGSIGTWQQTNDLPGSQTLFDAAVVTYGSRLYTLGGFYGGTGNTQDRVEYVSIDPAGMTSGWTSTTPATSFPARAGVCSVAYNGFLYALGGSSDDSNGDQTSNYYSAIASNGSIGNWTSTTALVNGTQGASKTGFGGCTAYNGRIYFMGGVSTGGTNQNIAIFATINSNGSLGTWSNITAGQGASQTIYAALIPYDGVMYSFGARGYSTAVIYGTISPSTGNISSWTTSNFSLQNNYYAGGTVQVGNYLYNIGGQSSGNTAQTAVQYASVNSIKNSTGSWSIATAGLPSATAFLHATVVNGCIYAFGGENTAGTSQAGSYIGCPSSNGNITSWATGPSLLTATTDQGVTSYNGFIYGVGGYSTSTQQYTQYAQVNNGGSGSLGSWTTSAHNFTTSRELEKSITYNGYLYIVAGNNGSGADLGDVQYAQLSSSSGDIGAFTTDTHSLNQIREDASLAVYNGYLYVLGGNNPGDGIQYNSYEYAPIGSSGALSGGFTKVTYAASGRAGTCAVAYNGYIYSVGGWDGSTDHADTVYSPLGSNGAATLSTWADSGHNFTNGRSEAGCFVANGYMYMLGGNGAANYNDAQSALINPDGSLGAWSATTSFTGIRENPLVTVYNGFAYVVSGCPNNGGSCSAPLSDVQFAPINANGTLGSWQNGTAVSGNTGYSTGFAYNGYLYLAAAASSSQTTVEYVPLNSISRTANYSKLVDLGAPMSVSSITYDGSLPPSNVTPGANSAIMFKSAGSDGVLGSLTNPSSIVPNTTTDNSCRSTSLNYTRYLWVNIAMDDSSTAVFPDADGTAANVTDFTVNALTPHPAPNIRLRGGQTLQAGTLTSNLSALDTCNQPQVASTGTPLLAGSGSSANLGVPAGVTNGSLVVAFVMTSWNQSFFTPDASLITPPTGSGTWNVGGSFEYADASAGNQTTLLTWFYKYATGNDSGNYSFSFGSISGSPPANIDGYSQLITGGPTSGNPFADSFHGASDGASHGTTVTVPTFTPGGNNSLLLAGFGYVLGPSGTATGGAPTGWGSDGQTSGSNQLIAGSHFNQSTVAATGSLAFTSTLSAAVSVLIGTIRGPTTPAVVQKAAGSTTNSTGTSATVSLPSATKVGDLILIISHTNNTAFSLPAGFTDITGSGAMTVFAEISQAGENSWNFTFPSTIYNWQAFEISGASIPAANPATVSGSGTNTIATPSSGIISTPSLLLGIGYGGLTGSAVGVSYSSVSSGWTYQQTSGPTAVNGGYNDTISTATQAIAAGTATGTFTFGSNATDLRGDVIVIP